MGVNRRMGALPEDPRSYEDATRRHYQDEAVAREYHAQFTTRLSLRTFSHVLVARAEQRTVRRLLANRRDEAALALDVPCGTGKLVSVLGDLALPTIGGDISRPMMGIARAGARAVGASWQFVQLDITQLPFPSSAFDEVICLRLLHRVPQAIKMAALRELGRVSRRHLLVSYGVSNPWHRVRQRLRRLVSRGNSIPYPISRRSADALFRDLGWRVAMRLSPLPVLSAEEMVLLVRLD